MTNFRLFVLVLVLGVAHFTQSMNFEQDLELAEASEFEALGQEANIDPDDCEDPPPLAPDCRTQRRKAASSAPGAPSAACPEIEQLEMILKLLKEVTPKLEAILKKTSKPKGVSGAPAKDVKSAVEGRRWSVHDDYPGDLRNVHSGGRGSRLRHRTPWRSQQD